MPDIDKVAAIILRNKKMLVCAKKGLNVLISPGGKREGNETDRECLDREMPEETGCEITNLRYYATYQGPSVHGDGTITMACYFGDIDGDPEVNPNDSVYAHHWIGRDYKEQGFKVAPLMEVHLIPALMRDGFM
jgi:8-oxo-dGTP diphosphatase